jgi:predicted transcriptional regulator
MSEKLKIGVGDARETAQGFVEAWRRAEQGERPAEPEQVLHFADLETLLRTLTPVRWVLLRVLRTGGPCSVRELARRVGRDYKNVHSDVKALERLELITRTTEGEIQVPWETVLAEMKLAA